MYSDGIYKASNPDWHRADSGWKAREIIRLIDDHCLNPESVAEVGCGGGGILRELMMALPKPTRFVGYDISPDAIAMANELSDRNLSFHLGDIPSDGRFDLLLCIDVIEHIENPFEFVRNLKSNASYKVFHIPMDLNALTAVRKIRLRELRKSVGHIHYFSKETALAFLTECGLEILDWRYTTGSIKTKRKSIMNGMIKPLRRIGFSLFPDFTVRAVGGFSLMVLTT